MWREQLDIFWDGGRLLALGFFDGADRAPAFGGRPELAVVAARDADFADGAALVDLIDQARWGQGCCLIETPADRPFLMLRAPDGAELRLTLSDERPANGAGEWRMLMTLQPDVGAGAPAGFRLAALSARGDFQRLAREQVALCGARLVWAFGQRRSVERRDGAARQATLWPAQRLFPAFQSRLVLEAVDLHNVSGVDARAAPFAIMDHWLRENGAPRVALRLRVPDSLDESAALLGRTSVVLAMNQRRRLRDWMKEQRDAGEPAIDPLTFDDIRQATGEAGEHPDAVETPDALVVVNLLKLIAQPDEADYDGFAIRRLTENAPGLGAALDIEFYGAALGDEIGLVGAAAGGGDLGVIPADPGGVPYIRLFRVESDGPRPRRVTDDDPLLDEILRRAADQENAAAGATSRSVAERAANLFGRREKLVAAVNAALSRAEFPGRIDSAAAWELLEPVAAASFAALVVQASPAERALLARLGGYPAYRADPSLVATLLRRPALADCVAGPLAVLPGEAARTLLDRVAAALDADGIFPPDPGPYAQQHMMRLLAQAPAKLLAARIALSGAADPVALADAAETLADAAQVAQAAEHLEAHGESEAAAALRGYLELRRQGGWIAPEEASEIAPLVPRARAEREAEAVEAARAAAAALTQPAAKPKGFLGAMRGLLGLGGQTEEV